MEAGPEDLTQERVASEEVQQKFETSGITNYLEVPEMEVLRPGQGDVAVSRSSSWINCGETIYSTNHGAGDHYQGDTYQRGCLARNYGFHGPDKKYLLHVPELMDVSFELSELHKDLDLFIFTANWAYGPQHCIAYSVNSYNKAEKMTIRMNPGVYVILIDGQYHSNVSSFKFKVTCGGGNDCEDFDSYFNGNISSQSTDWRKWTPSATFDGQVTSNRSFSPHKSLYIDHKPGYSASNQMDVVRKVGSYSSGHYLLKWKMYVPHGRNAAFNFQKYNNPGVQSGLVVYLRSGRGIAVKANNQVYQSPKTYRQGRWIDIFVDYDLSGKRAVLSVDDKIIASWDTTLRSNTPANGANRLGGVNYWAYHDYTTCYIDDFCVEDIGGIIIDYFYGDGVLFLD